MNPYREPAPRADYDPPRQGDRVRPFDMREFDGDGIVIGNGFITPELLLVSVPDGIGLRRGFFWPEQLYVVRRSKVET